MVVFTRLQLTFDHIEYFYTTITMQYTHSTREEMGMQEEHLQEVEAELEKVGEQLQETHHYIHELRISYAFDALVLAGLAIVVFQTFSFLASKVPVTTNTVIFFMFSMLIGPAALFLFLLHCYELYSLTKHGEKSIPLTLDVMYFVYIPLAFATISGLSWYYLRHNIPWQILTPGWSLAVVLLLLGVFVALLIAKGVVTVLVAPLLPHFFKQHEHHATLHRLFEKHVAKPSGIYYFRKKANNTLWENQDCFVYYKS
jgi:hypothetical protein